MATYRVYFYDEEEPRATIVTERMTYRVESDKPQFAAQLMEQIDKMQAILNRTIDEAVVGSVGRWNYYRVESDDAPESVQQSLYK